ncbi:DUF6477 family protein [Phaeobacter sp.]|uniref:DUF6477 family protein n=1 Tax=Phaeobacter sp. TaxID=1902409 RepID=UPI0026005E5C|nr:DUF6477 family protein [Phaeobacter sp.]
MTDTLTQVQQLNRPSLLVRAARIGAAQYRRKRDLRRILGTSTLPPVQSGLARLLQLETDHEQRRHLGDGSYDVRTHLTVLIAVLAEGRAALAEGRAALQHRGADRQPQAQVGRHCHARELAPEISSDISPDISPDISSNFATGLALGLAHRRPPKRPVQASPQQTMPRAVSQRQKSGTHAPRKTATPSEPPFRTCRRRSNGISA